MNILDNFKTKIRSSTETAFALNSVREYFESAKDKIAEWASNTKPVNTPQVIYYEEDGIVHSYQLTFEEYMKFVTDPTYSEYIGQNFELTASIVLAQISVWPEETIDYAMDKLQLEIPIDDTTSYVGILSAIDYQNAVNGLVNSVQIQVSATGEYITRSADQVVELVEDLAQTAVVQSEFMAYCLENESVEANDFISRIKARTTGISTVFIERYSSLLQSGDPVSAIYSFFSTFKNVDITPEVIDENELVVIYKKSEYAGAQILTLTINKILDGASFVVNTIMKYVARFIDFTVSLTAAIIKVSKTLLKLIAKRYFTRYTTTSKNFGVMDLPFLQLTLGYLSNLDYDANVNVSLTPWCRSADRKNPALMPTYYAEDCAAIMNSNRVLNVWEHMQFWKNANYVKSIYQVVLCTVIDGINYIRPVDVFLPNINDPTSGVILRVGVAANNSESWPYRVTLQGYFFVSKGWLENQEHDKAVFAGYGRILDGCMQNLSTILPVFNPLGRSHYDYDLDMDIFSETPTDIYNNVDRERNWFVFDAVEPGEDNYDVVEGFNSFDMDSKIYVQGTDPEPAHFRWLFCGFIPYFILCAGGEFTIDQVCWNDARYHDLTYITDHDQRNQWRTASYWNQSQTFPATIDRDSYFAPYLQRNVTPVAIHYQTSDEVSNEWIQLIVISAVAAAAVYVSVKWNKFKRNRLIKAELAQGYSDNMSWNLSQRPTKNELKEYRKARKRAMKINNLNAILGLTSPNEQSTNFLLSSIEQIKDQYLGKDGVDPASGEYPETFTSGDIHELIIQIRNLIKIIS